MLFADLPDHCLLLIFDYCDLGTQAAWSTVSTQFKAFIRDNFFRKKSNYCLCATSTNDVVNNMTTVARLVTTTNPRSFNLNIRRNLPIAKEFSIITIDMNSSITEVFVDSHFLRRLNGLDNICGRIRSVHIRCSIYDCLENDGVNMDNIIKWTNLKKLAISGYNKSVLHMLHFPVNEWQLEIVSFRDMFITADFINNVVLNIGKHLKNIIFENCKLDEVLPDDLIAIAESVQNGAGRFPIGLTFINVALGESFLEALQNDVFATYIYIAHNQL